MNVIYNVCWIHMCVWCVVKGYKKEHADDCKLPQQIEAKSIKCFIHS